MAIEGLEEERRDTTEREKRGEIREGKQEERGDEKSGKSGG